MSTPDTLIIDRLLPDYTKQEYHDIAVRGTVEDAYAALKEVDFSQSPVIVILFKLAGMPVKTFTLDGFTQDCSFSWLGENRPEEMALGFVFTNTFTSIESPEDYSSERPDLRLRLIWNFRCERLSNNLTLVSTETRVQCVTPASRRFFSAYWAIIRPFSGWIRRIMLKLIKKQVEQRG